MKTVWILPGGGARGAVQVGMIKKAVKTIGWPDCIIGTSVGSLNGSLAACKNILPLEKVWRSIESPKDIYGNRAYTDWLSKALFFINSSFYHIKPLQKLLDEHLDLDKLVSSDIDFYACAWNANTNKSALFSKHGNIRAGIEASISIPMVFPETVINDEYYFDGGVRDNAPTKYIFKKDDYGKHVIGFKPDRVVIMLPGILKNYSRVGEKFDKVPKIAVRALDAIITEGQFNDVQMMLDRNQIPEYSSVETIVCQPIKDVIGTMDFYPDKIRRAIQVGEASWIANTRIYNEDNNYRGGIFVSV